MSAPARDPEEASSQRQIRRQELAILGVLAAVQFTSIVDFMVVMPLGVELMEALNIGAKEVGMIVSSYTFATGVGGLVASALIDRFSRRTTFLTLFAGFLVGTLLCGLAPTYPLLVAARVATGAFGGILGGMALAIIGDVFPEERRGRATGALMSGFALASVAGVPFGLYLGTKIGWHAPFIALVILGLPVLVVGALVLPPLNDHIGKVHAHPLRQLRDTLWEPNHLKAFALIVALMIGSFALIPYISPFLVANTGMPKEMLTWMYVLAGALTLFTSPLVGRLADYYGKLPVYRVIAPLSAITMLGIAWLPNGAWVLGISLVAALMVFNAGRMVAAMAMVTGSVEPARRGGFMSANSSIQHIACGIGAYVGGLVLQKASDGRLLQMEIVGLIAAGTTLLTLWIAGWLRPFNGEAKITPAASLAAAAEATADAGEPAVNQAAL